MEKVELSSKPKRDKITLTYPRAGLWPTRQEIPRSWWRSMGTSSTPLSFSAFLSIPACLGAKIDVHLEHDHKLLQTRRSLRIAPRVRKAPVFVGGEETDMIVIFPSGRFFKGRLHTVPVKENEPDTD
ncbi:hypothetical protein [Amycolatopsis sp. cmx-4-54]|uniref:hypothetical protein n=1 Tax=Amycolatopsis sp. cmx-4-54 TaxID=2790936 RepID=UPI003977E912